MKKILFILCIASGLAGKLPGQPVAAWLPLGPIQFPSNVSGQINGIGRVCQMKFHPTNPQKVYAVSASGGLWISQDGTQTWAKCGTDALPLTACASVCVDWSNDSILYVGTGDPNYYSTGLGIYKSTDGGLSWLPSHNGCGTAMAVELLMDPTDHLTLVAATSGGLFKTTDGGITWVNKLAVGQFTDMEMKPAAGTRTLYAVNYSELYKSEDFGETWTQITNGIAVPGGGSGQGMRLAVSAADTNTVYAGMIKDEGTIFRSTDGGNSFTTVYHNPSQSLVGYDVNGNGQGNYNFTMAADPTNANTVFVGAHVVWKSTNGGVNWTQLTQWWAVLHTDMHDYVFNPYNPTELYNCNDGGVWRSTNGGSAWQPRSNGLSATEIYKAANDPKRKDIISIGTQDNGELYSFLGTWKTNRGGDWTSRAQFDYTSTNRVYYYENGKRRQLNISSAENAYALPLTPGSSTLKLAFTPLNPDMALAGINDLYLTQDLTSANPVWGSMTTFSGAIKAMEFAAWSEQTIYVLVAPNKIWKGSDLSMWSPVWSTYTLPATASNSASIATLPNDTNVVYLSLGSKVYRSGNQGQTWVNESFNLPNINIIKIIHDPYSTDESVYICNAAGVWYKNKNMSIWTGYNQGLPFVADITDFMFFDDGIDSSLIRVATYGRGMWETRLASAVQGIRETPTPTILLYPNPAREMLRIQASETLNGWYDFSLYTLDGKLAKSSRLLLAEGKGELELGRLAAGNYQLVLYHRGRITGKATFLKE